MQSLEQALSISGEAQKAKNYYNNIKTLTVSFGTESPEAPALHMANPGSIRTISQGPWCPARSAP